MLGAGRANDVPNNIVAGGLTIDTDTLHVDSTNNRVGIGTASPNDPLHVSGAVTLSASGSNDSGNSHFPFSDGRFYYTADPETGGTGDHVFRHFSGGSYVEQMRILQNGNVGINDSTPSYTLDVNGDINATGSIRKNGTPIYGIQVAQTTVSATSSFAYYLLNMPSGVTIFNLVSICPVEGVNNRLHIAEVALGNWAGAQSHTQILIYCRLGNGVHLEPYYINFYYRV